MTYTDTNRGTIQFRNRRKQIIDFSGLRCDNITPTDCDGIIEYKNKAYVLFEIKYRNAEVPRGQFLALTRMVDDYKRANKYAILIIAEHNVDDAEQDIDAANCKIRKWYDGTWRQNPLTLKELIDRFIKYVDSMGKVDSLQLPEPAPVEEKPMPNTTLLTAKKFYQQSLFDF